MQEWVSEIVLKPIDTPPVLKNSSFLDIENKQFQRWSAQNNGTNFRRGQLSRYKGK